MGKGEGKIIDAIMLRATELGGRMFRNNCGTVQDARSGDWVSYGVGRPGGSDLIGFMPVTIDADAIADEILKKFWSITSTELEEIEHATPEIASIIRAAIPKLAIFCGVEVKYGKTKTTRAQNNFNNMLQSAGAISGIVRSVEEFEEVYLSYSDKPVT